MVKVSVSESYAMDMLAILRVKSLKTKTEISQQNFDSLYFELLNQLKDDFLSAYRSQEYLDLWKVNGEIFDLVDKIKIEPTDALVVDAANYKRFVLKQKIQDKYFGGGRSEEKIGYEQK